VHVTHALLNCVILRDIEVSSIASILKFAFHNWLLMIEVTATDINHFSQLQQRRTHYSSLFLSQNFFKCQKGLSSISRSVGYVSRYDLQVMQTPLEFGAQAYVMPCR